MLAVTLLPAESGSAQGNSRAFPETGKSVKGKFLDYWTTHGGLAQQGYPISDEMQEKSDTDGKTYTVQYFERAVFESHPENKAPYDVLLSLLGNFYYKQKYPNGAPGQAASTAPGAVKYAQTGHTIGGKFLTYWQQHGGLAQQGYPISEEFKERNDLDGKTYTVQYFERAVFESHLENQPPYDVLLSQLGTFRYKARYTAGTQAPAEVSVKIVDFGFQPSAITVPVGTKVTWNEVGPTEHNTVSKTGLWESPIMSPGQKFSYTFTRAGTYEYWCTLHPDMEATVTVTQK